MKSKALLATKNSTSYQYLTFMGIWENTWSAENKADFIIKPWTFTLEIKIWLEKLEEVPLEVSRR